MKTSKIIAYIENMYKKNSNMIIEITKIKLSNTQYNRYSIEFIYDYMDGNIPFTSIDGEVFLDLEKITYFDNSIDWSKNKFYKEKPARK